MKDKKGKTIYIDFPEDNFREKHVFGGKKSRRIYDQLATVVGCEKATQLVERALKGENIDQEFDQIMNAGDN